LTSEISDIPAASSATVMLLTVFSWEEGFALEHLRKDTTGTPDIDCM
jgi:hypothetical protein